MPVGLPYELPAMLLTYMVWCWRLLWCVVVAGAWKGIHRAPDALVANILDSRRMNEIEADVSVVYDIAEQVGRWPHPLTSHHAWLQHTPAPPDSSLSLSFFPSIRSCASTRTRAG